MMNKILNAVEKFFKAGAIISFAGLIFVVLLQVYARLFLPRSPHWTEEASRFLFLFTVAFAAGAAMRQRAFVNVDVFVSLAKGKLRSLIQLALDVVIFIFMFIITDYSLVNVKIGAIQTSASLAIPMNYIFGSITLLAAGICIFAAELICKDVKELWTM